MKTFNFGPEVQFSVHHFEENAFNEKDLIRLEAFGLSMEQDFKRPVLLLKDKAGVHTLPVGLNNLEAGIILAQNQKSQSPQTPHDFTLRFLESMNVKVSRCVFVELKGPHQFVRLYFEGHPHYGSMKWRADKVMSLCLQLGVEIFATPEIIHKSRALNLEVESVLQTLGSDLLTPPRNQKYLM